IAHDLDAKYIRVFSFYMQKEQKTEYQDQVVERFREMVKAAASAGVVLIHENDAGLYGEGSIQCKYLLDSLNSPWLRAAFDPSNFLIAGEEPAEESFPRLTEYVSYLHVKDSVRGTGQIVIAGQGDARVRDVLAQIKNREDFYISLEPHLDFAGEARGFTGPELIQKDLDALRGILEGLGVGAA
ncbi:MAG TPA: xylose isomerase, partial [Clostridiales bacterium]|nr:xylose isomerase [Clostridiales bacterium]